MRYAKLLKAFNKWPLTTEYDERLEEDGTSNVVSVLQILDQTIHSQQSKDKILKIHHREIRVKMERPAYAPGQLKFFVRREDAAEEWIYEKVFTLAYGAREQDAIRDFDTGTLDTGTNSTGCHCVGVFAGNHALFQDTRVFCHIEFSLFLPLGEVLRTDCDAVLVCGGQQFPVNRNYVSHFSKYLNELFSNDHDDSNEYQIEVCTSDEFRSFLDVITRLHPKHCIYRTSSIAANRALLGAHSVQTAVETTELWRNSRWTESVVSHLKSYKDLKLPSVFYDALIRIKMEDFAKNKWKFDELDEETKKLCEERRVELEGRKKDEEREEVEMTEWKKKKEEERKRILKMTHRKENRKEKKGLEREKKRMRKEKKRNVM